MHCMCEFVLPVCPIMYALIVFTNNQLEVLVSGSPSIDVSLLKEKTEYRGNVHGTDPHIVMFWEILSEWNKDELAAFLQFVWGRSRLPHSSSLGFGKDLFKISDHVQAVQTGKHDAYLPVSHTCLLSSTRVLTDTYEYIPAHAVSSCTKLLGPTGNSITVRAVQKLLCDRVYTIQYGEGEEEERRYTVSANHRVTFSCAYTPTVSIMAQKGQGSTDNLTAIVTWLSPDCQLKHAAYSVNLNQEQTSIADIELHEHIIAGQYDDPNAMPLLSEADELIIMQRDAGHVHLLDMNQFLTALSSHGTDKVDPTIDAELRERVKLHWLSNTPRNDYMLSGQLGEIAANELYAKFKLLGLNGTSPLIRGYINQQAVYAMERAAQSKDTSRCTAPGAIEQVSILSTANHKYEPIQHCDTVNVIYQIFSSSPTDNSNKNTSADAAHQIEYYHSLLKLEAIRSDGIVVTELPRVYANEEEQLPVSEAQYAQLCQQNIQRTISMLPRTILVFGIYGQCQWQDYLIHTNEAHHITHVKWQWNQGIYSLQFSIDKYSTIPHPITVFFAPELYTNQPNLLRVMMQAILLSHAHSPYDTLNALALPSDYYPNITACMLSGHGSYEVVNIEIEAEKDEERRYTIEGGIVTR